MATQYRAFIHGSGAPPQHPLARFIPPLPEGMVRACLVNQAPPGTWIIDPIASTPLLALEAARAGYRVLVVSNNPILSFMLEVLAEAPAPADFQSAVSELASARRGDERLQIHYQSLYQTDCPNCGQRIQAAGYVWKKDEIQPHRREIICPFCRLEGEFAPAPFDLERLNLPGNPQLHHARAIERISAARDDTREGAEEALRAYLPRPLYFITTLINKIEGLPASAERKRLLLALALSVCDKANTLWPHPGGRSRPRQLTTPPEFLENNLWSAFEQAVPEWSGQPGRVPLTRWPILPPPGGGICLFSGRLKNLLPLPESIPLHSALVVLPRPNQAFWTLSAIWSGWLWGREAVQPLSGALERRRYDWQWHTAALHSTFSALERSVPAGFSLLGLLPELVPGFLAAAMVAAGASGFRLEQAAFSPEPEFAQLSWRSGRAGQSSLAEQSPQRIIRQAAVDHLTARNEPTLYLPIYTAGLVALADHNLLPPRQAQLPYDTLTRLQNLVSDSLSDQATFRHYGSRVTVESGWWWLNSASGSSELPLADRVEVEVARRLLKQARFTQVEVEADLAQQFTGLLTPSGDLVRECLESYAEPDNTTPPRWILRDSEHPETRRNDVRAVQVGLGRLAKRLGFTAEGEFPVIWRSGTGVPVLYLYPIISAIISRAVYSPAASPRNCVLVIPGSRARLISYKLRRDPRLAEAAGQGWRFLKFRLLRELLTRAELSESLFQELLDSDPPTWDEAVQMSFL